MISTTAQAGRVSLRPFSVFSTPSKATLTLPEDRTGEKLLRVPHFWPEKGAKIDRRALRRALKRLASLNGVEKLELRFTN